MSVSPAGGTEPTVSAPSRERVWNGGTWAVLAAGIVLVLVAASALVFAQTQAHARGNGEAAEVAEAFVESAAGDSDAWRDLSSARLINTYQNESPLRLDAETTEALDMQLEYDTGELQFTTSLDPNSAADEGDADSAYMIIDLRYHWKAWEYEFTHSVQQQIWLTRPFYYGDDIPDRADPQRQPTAVGPWRVTMLSYPQFSEMDPNLGASSARTDLKTTDRTPGFPSCESVGSLFEQLSDGARTSGKMRSTCWLKEDGSSIIGDDVDPNELAAALPVYGLQSPPDSAFRLRTMMEGKPLLAQYPIRTSNGDYIITLGAGSENGVTATFEDYQLRIISIQKSDRP